MTTTPVFLPGRGAWWATVHGIAVVPKCGCNWHYSLGIWECGGLATKMTGVGSEMQMFWHEWGSSAQWGGSCLVGHHVSAEGWGQREARGMVSITAHLWWQKPVPMSTGSRRYGCQTCSASAPTCLQPLLAWTPSTCRQCLPSEPQKLWLQLEMSVDQRRQSDHKAYEAWASGLFSCTDPFVSRELGSQKWKADSHQEASVYISIPSQLPRRSRRKSTWISRVPATHFL